MKRRDLLAGGAGLVWLPLGMRAAKSAEDAARITLPARGDAADASRALSSSVLTLLDSRFPMARAMIARLDADGMAHIDVARRDLVSLWRERLERELASGTTLAGLTRHSDWQLLRGSAIHHRPRVAVERVDGSPVALYRWRLDPVG